MKSHCDNLFGQSASAPTQPVTRARVNSIQLNSTSRSAQLSTTQSASEASARASHCEQHLLTKVRLAVSFYYLVTMMCRFKVLSLLTPRRLTG